MAQPRFSLWQMLGFAAIVLAMAGGAFLSGLFVGHRLGVVSARAERDTFYPAPSFTGPELPNSGPHPLGLPFLGVRFEPVTAALAAQEGLTVETGALVRRVERGSPAEAAGVRPGDVLVALNGIPIGGPHDLPQLVRSHEPGDSVVLTIVRADKTFEVTATLATAAGD